MMNVDDLRVIQDNQFIDEDEFDEDEEEEEQDEYSYEDYCYDFCKAERDEEAWF